MIGVDWSLIGELGKSLRLIGLLELLIIKALVKLEGAVIIIHSYLLQKSK